jgi:hypothetical protein
MNMYNQPPTGGPDGQPSSVTIAMYKKAYRAVLQQATEEVQVAIDEHVFLTPSDLVRSLKSNPTHLRVRTQQLRRSALLWVFRETNPPGAGEAIKELLQWKPAMDTPALIPLDRKTRTPGRMIPKSDLEALSTQLMRMGEWGARAEYMLMSGVICGARPIEWINSAWVSSDVLRISTAKDKYHNAWDAIPPGTFTDHEEFSESDISKSNERGNGPSVDEIDFERRLSETHLDLEKDQELVEDLRRSRIGTSTTLFRDVRINGEDARVVVLHMAAIKTVMTEMVGPGYGDLPKEELEEAFRKFYFHPVRNVLWRACKKAFSDDRTYGLADARSTFAANRKRQYGLKQTSLDMGHSGTRTTRGSYASGRLGWASKARGEQDKSAQGELQRADKGTSVPGPEAGQRESEAPSH